MNKEMKELSNIWSILLEETGWKKMSVMQKIIVVWFCLSVSSLCICGESILLAILAVVNLGASSCCLRKYVNVEE